MVCGAKLMKINKFRFEKRDHPCHLIDMNIENTANQDTIKGQEALKRISLKIKRLRKKSHYTQKDVAERLNLGLRSYQRIENRECGYDLSLLYRLCEVFNANFFELTNPYAPKDIHKNFFFNDRSEFKNICSCESIDFLENLELNPENITADEAFMSATVPLALVTPFKVEFNKKAKSSQSRFVTALGLKNETATEQFWDEVLFHQPKFSAVKITNDQVIVSRHFYNDHEEYMISGIFDC